MLRYAPKVHSFEKFGAVFEIIAHTKNKWHFRPTDFVQKLIVRSDDDTLKLTIFDFLFFYDLCGSLTDRKIDVRTSTWILVITNFSHIKRATEPVFLDEIQK